MKNTKRLSLIFDEALRDATRDFAKEMAYKIIDKNDVSIYDKPKDTFLKITAFIKSKKIQSERQAKFG